MQRFVVLSLVFIAVLGVAVYDGILNYRWTSNQQAEAYAEMLGRVPKEFGPWKGKDYEVDDDILRVAGAKGYVSRAYVNEETNETIKVWLIVGPFKHIVRHTPDICYKAQDYRMAGGSGDYQFDVEGVENLFLTNNFSKQNRSEQVFWSWLNPDETGDLKWYASGPHVIRERYAGTPALFKLYFTTICPGPGSDPAESPSNGFAKLFLPMLTKMIQDERLPESGA